MKISAKTREEMFCAIRLAWKKLGLFGSLFMRAFLVYLQKKIIIMRIVFCIYNVYNSIWKNEKKLPRVVLSYFLLLNVQQNGSPNELAQKIQPVYKIVDSWLADDFFCGTAQNCEKIK